MEQDGLKPSDPRLWPSIEGRLQRRSRRRRVDSKTSPRAVPQQQRSASSRVSVFLVRVLGPRGRSHTSPAHFFLVGFSVREMNTRTIDPRPSKIEYPRDVLFKILLWTP